MGASSDRPGYRPQQAGGMSYDMPNQPGAPMQAAQRVVDSGAAPADQVGRFGPGYTDRTMNIDPGIYRAALNLRNRNWADQQQPQGSNWGREGYSGFDGIMNMMNAPRWRR